MGMDGGCKLTKIADVKKEWKRIRNDMLARFESGYFSASKGSYDEQSYAELSNIVDCFPKNIDNLSNNEIIKLLKPFECCDCPALYDDILVTGYGDNVLKGMNVLSGSLPGVNYETWT